MTQISRLKLLSREDCGLCEDTARDLTRLGVAFDTIDIDRDEALAQRYGEAIPVLLLGERELARAPLGATALEKALRQAGLLREQSPR
ncbi:MAG TPA: glutaredoxin family protein [Dehalococcoidia bacterium]